MNQQIMKEKKYSFVLILCMIIGLLSAFYLIQQRYHIEEAQNHIENIVDYDAVLRATSFEKRSTPDAMKALRDAGVTAFAIYDRTLEKASDAGEVEVVKGNGVRNIVQMYGGTPKPGALYIVPAPGKEGYYKEIREDLLHRLGSDKVRFYNSSRGEVMELYGAPFEAFTAMNLGISRLQALEVSNRGFNVIVRPTNFKDITPSDIDYVFSRINGVPNVTGMVFTGKESLGAPKYMDQTLKLLKATHIPLIGIEATSQLQYEPQLGFNEMANAEGYSVGRLYTISKDELKKVDPEEAAQRFYISDIERNIRFNLFPLYDSGQNNETSLQTSINYIHSASEKLTDKGYELGRGSVYPPYKANPLLVVITMVGAISLFVFVGQMLYYVSTHRQLVIFFGLSLLSIVLYVVTNGTLITQIWALSSAVMAPVGAMILLMNQWEKTSLSTPMGHWKATGYGVFQVIATAVFATVGAMYIAAMLGNTRFFMEFAIFRGVKLAFVLPLILVAIGYFQRFPLWKGKTLSTKEEGIQFIKDFFTMEVRFYVFLVVAALGLVGWVFVGRSGHTAGVPVPQAEIVLRRFLENTLYARPREKEFIIGHPALMLAAYAVLRKWPMGIHFFLTLAGSIGVASMVETFCHIRTPVMMSIMRGYDGLWIGLIIGLVLVLAVRILTYITQWYLNREGGHE